MKWDSLKKWLKGESLFVSPGFLLGILIAEVIYWSRPNWAQVIRFPTHEESTARHLAACVELVGDSCELPIVVHDGAMPIPPEALPEWTLIRVEQRFDSGFTVVSALLPGPHGNFQILVRDLNLPLGSVFRRFKGRILMI